MKLKEKIAHFIDRYSLLAILVLAAILMVFALIACIALICTAPGWRVVAYFGLAGIIIVGIALGWGIYDEIRNLRKLS